MLRLIWFVLFGVDAPWAQVKKERCVDGYCGARPSPACSDGRCRMHCRGQCKCKEDPPPILELPRENREGGTYREMPKALPPLPVPGGGRSYGGPG